MDTAPPTIFQASDLANNRVQFLDAARAGQARLRDKDGTSLVMLPEARLHFLESVASWSSEQLRLAQLLDRDELPSVSELGTLAWLRVFDKSDLREFVGELQDVLIAATSDGNLVALDEMVSSWRLTAQQLQDPLRRSVLLAQHSNSDFVTVHEPAAE